MTEKIKLKPGAVSFAAWRSIAQGATFRLHENALPAVIAGAEAVERIVARGTPVYGINTGFGKLASVRIQADDIGALQRNIVISHSAGVGAPTPADVVRLMLALKLTSLARGASGVRPETLLLLEQMCEREVIPLVPAQGSVGASGDLAPLAHMAATMIGVGDAYYRGEKMPAARALERAQLEPIILAPKEGLALLNGTQFSTAHALSALFATERVFRTALVSGALTTEAAKGSDTPFDPRIHALRGHRSQIDVAEALRDMMAGSAIRASHLANDDRIQDPYCLRCQPQVMGAALGVLRQAGDTLLTEANGVSDNPLIFPETDEALSGGNFHAEAVAFAADMIALAICEIGSLAERRVAMLVDPSLSRLPAFLTSLPGLNSGLMMTQIVSGGPRIGKQAAGLPGERGFDPNLGKPGRSCVNVRARRPSSGADGRQCRQYRRNRAPLPPRKAVTSMLRLPRAMHSNAYARLLRSQVPPLKEDRFARARHCGDKGSGR